MGKAPKEKNPLGRIVDEIYETKKIADSNPRIREINGKKTEVTMPHVIRQLEAKKRQAQGAAEELFIEYRNEVKESAAFVVVVGDSSDEFAQKAHEQLNTFSYAATQMYQDMVDQIPEKVYLNKMSDKVLLEHIVARFEDKALSIGIHGYKGFVFQRKFAKMLGDKADVVDLISDIFHEHVGTEVLGMDSIHRASQDGIENGFGGLVVPIVLHTKSLEIAKKIIPSLLKLSPHVVSIKAGKLGSKEKISTDLSVVKVNNKSVEEAMLKVKDKVM